MIVTEQALIERYKWILERKRDLNNATFKIAVFYQTAASALLASEFAVLFSVNKGELSIDIAYFSTTSIFLLFCAVTGLGLCLIIGGIFSWVSYRNDEIKLESVIGIAIAGSPNFSGLLRWYETYIATVMLAMFFFGLWGYIEIIEYLKLL
ncbi:hypothetical protein O4H52_13360 [Sphingomonadaceae bacterium G21617-S1]|jgi:hypothetical protein|nr:hypothetical protein [Sphingomonadaceae bacterium G21617-S1]